MDAPRSHRGRPWRMTASSPGNIPVSGHTWTRSAALVSCSTEKSGWSPAKAHPAEILSVPTFVPDQAAASPLQRRQNFLRLGLGHLTQHHELIPTDAEDFPPISHRLGDTLGSAAYQLVPRLMPQGIVDTSLGR